MLISGFTILRNADNLYYPYKESIFSVLPYVDEFIIALGASSAGDKTEQVIQSWNHPKIKIYPRIWDEALFKSGKILAVETNFALQQCKGDWCFYIQADEVLANELHMDIRELCNKYNTDDNVDGLLFSYRHFFGDYNHILDYHGYYHHEIRLFKNHKQVVSLRDAQSFRKQNNQRLNVVSVPVYIHHYGWVRPPDFMQRKKREFESLYRTPEEVEKTFDNANVDFNYGDLTNIPQFKGKHPEIMTEKIASLDWEDQLISGGKQALNRPKMKHEQLKYKIISWIERNIFGGKQFFGYSNWNIIKRA